MKSTIKMSLVIAFTCVLMTTSVLTNCIFAQDSATKVSRERDFVFNPTVFSPTEMKEMWNRFSGDENWKALMEEVKQKGFTRVLNKEMSWGFKGTLTNDRGEKKDVIFCAFDFMNTKDYKQGCSMIWKVVGKDAYKAYLVFPSGETDSQKRFEGGQEWFAENGKVQKAHSWGHRFQACVQRGVSVPGIETELSNNKSKVSIGGGTYTITCQTSCLASAIACSGLASATAIITAGVIAASGGTLTIPALIAAGGFGAAVLISCAATGCGTCIFMCALAAF